MGLTQKEIAKQLGVSYMSVSRALNGSGYVSESLRMRILTYAKENGYEPHRASQVLVRNTTHRIALFSSSLPHYFWDEIEKGVQVAAQQLKAFNYETTYHRIPEQDTQAYLEVLEQELQKGLDAIGLVFQRKYDMQAILARIEQANVPYVTFNVDGDTSKRRTFIGCDYRSGGRLAADFIARTLQLSAKKEVLVLLCDEEGQLQGRGPDINKLRLDGFLSFMEENFPTVTIHTEYFSTKLQVGYQDNQILELIKQYQDQVQAIYMISAFNTDFLHALECLPNHDFVTILHDLDNSAIRHLKTRLLSAVIDQSPTLQGYYTVMALERIVESKGKNAIANLKLEHNLVLSENRHLIEGLIAAKLMQ